MMVLPLGSWMGSTDTLDDIAYLRDTRRLPRAEEVEVRLPQAEREPRPEGSERVVFLRHFKRGFGLRAASSVTFWSSSGSSPTILAPTQ